MIIWSSLIGNYKLEKKLFFRLHKKKMNIHSRLNIQNRCLRGFKLIDYKKTLKLTSVQKSILIGGLLGDLSIPKQINKLSYNIKFEQSIKQQNYVWHLYDMFEPFVGTHPKARCIKGGGAKNRQSIWFRTYKHVAFKFYYDLFYPRNNLNQRKKKVPKNIHKFLNARALAYWFMDDGSSNKKNLCFYFNTQGFCYSDIMLLKKALKSNFNLDTTIYRDRNYYLLYVQRPCNNLFVK
jgi:LAGLIDADG DNA endonuclease family